MTAPIDRVTLAGLSVWTVAKDADPGAAAGRAFAELEAALPSLQGRRFYGYYEPSARRYVACVVARDDDALSLERRTLSGGPYARMRLRGKAPALYAGIGPAFDELARSADPDPSRPWLEHYRGESEVDVLLPVR